MIASLFVRVAIEREKSKNLRDPLLFRGKGQLVVNWADLQMQATM